MPSIEDIEFFSPLFGLVLNFHSCLFQSYSIHISLKINVSSQTSSLIAAGNLVSPHLPKSR